MTKKLRVFEAFAGYGGASFGLRKSGLPYQVVGYSEIDQDAIDIFDLNFPGIHNYGDIKEIEPHDLPDFDLFTGGFPCQPFSTVGKRKGELDTRGTLFQDIINICSEKLPSFILLENVKGLTLGKQKPTFEKILSELKRIGYEVKWDVLNSKHYGVPQNRERLWIFGYRVEPNSDFDITPPKEEVIPRLSEFLDKSPDKELYRSQAQIDRIKFLHKVEEFQVDEPLCYDYYNRKLRTDGVCMTVTSPEHNVTRIVEPQVDGNERVRKLSIDEHYRLMGFQVDGERREIEYPTHLSYARLGRKAGNGWDVNLAGILFRHVFNNFT